jgi:hypothetical protein
MAEQSLRERLQRVSGHGHEQIDPRAARARVFLMGAIGGLVLAGAMAFAVGPLWGVPGLVIAAASFWGFTQSRT